jgi:hypothetical protein
MRTVSVHVMWDAQEKITSRPEHLWDAKDRTRGLLWRRDPLGRQVSEDSRGIQAPSPPLSWHFHRPPPYSVRKVRDLGMETRVIPTNPYSAGVLGAANQGKAVGATSWRGRLPASGCPRYRATPDSKVQRGTIKRLQILMVPNQAGAYRPINDFRDAVLKSMTIFQSVSEIVIFSSFESVKSVIRQ